MKKLYEGCKKDKLLKCMFLRNPFIQRRVFSVQIRLRNEREALLLIHDQILGINERENIANFAISSIDIFKIRNTCNITICCKIISALMI